MSLLDYYPFCLIAQHRLSGLRLGLGLGWKDGGGGGEGHDSIIYKTVYLDFPKLFYFILIHYANLCKKSDF